MIGQEAGQAGSRNSNGLSRLGDFPGAARELVQNQPEGRRITGVLRVHTQSPIANRHAIGPYRRRSRRHAEIHCDRFSQPAERRSTILMLRASFPGGYDDAAGPMDQPDCGLGLIPVLSPGSANPMSMNFAFGQKPGVVEIESPADLVGRQELFFVCVRHCEVK